jgi:hypothetical protein
MQNPGKLAAVLAIASTLSLGAVDLACASGVMTVIVKTAPPAPRVEVRPATPGPDHVWVAGSWKWTGRSHVWVSGKWVKRPTRSATWVAGRWQRKEAGWAWVPGHWRR